MSRPRTDVDPIVRREHTALYNTPTGEKYLPTVRIRKTTHETLALIRLHEGGTQTAIIEEAVEFYLKEKLKLTRAEIQNEHAVVVQGSFTHVKPKYKRIRAST